MESSKAGSATGQEPQGTVRCACGRENQAGRKFCTQCGASLAEPCIRCGEMAKVDERFCGGCGTELVPALREQIEQFAGDLCTAEDWQARGRFDEALSLLVPISKATHPRLLRHAAEARQKIQLISRLRDLGIQGAEAAVEESRRRMADHDYAAAAASLQAIPISVRTPEVAHLLDDALAFDRETAALNGMLREAVAKKDYAALLKVVKRLLELQPRHAEALNLGAKLQKKYLAAAAEQLHQGRYEQAIKVLDQVPRPLWSDETADLHQRAADRAWLGRTLRTAAVIDPVLVAAGCRAAELMPGDPTVAKLNKELQRRLKVSDEADGIVPPPWAAAPAASALGPHVEWITGFRRIVVAETCDRQVLRDGRGGFAVACGLALQGLGLAAVRMDLRPKAGGVVDLVAGIVRRAGSRASWGIDIGSESLKAVKLAPDEHDGAPRLEAALQIQHRKSLGQANNAEEKQVLVEESLAALLAQHDLKTGHIAAGLPGRMVFTRMFKLPPSDGKKLDAMVQHEVQRHMPVKIDALVWDYAALDGEKVNLHGLRARRMGAANGTALLERKAVDASATRAAHKSWNVVVTAARRAEVESCLAILGNLGVKLDLVQCECTALYNFLAYEWGSAAAVLLPPTAVHRNGSARNDPSGHAATANGHAGSHPFSAPVAVLDLGHEGSRLVICSPSELSVRNLGFGGFLLTRALVKELNLTTAAAERYKRDPLAAPSVAQIYAAVGPVLQDLLQELKIALGPLDDEKERLPIEKICLSGGAVRFHGLLKFLQSGT